MKIIWTIFRKELLETWRDRRTMVVMVLVPLLFAPFSIGAINLFQFLGTDSWSAGRTLEIGWAAADNAVQMPGSPAGSVRWSALGERSDPERALRARDLDAVVLLPDSAHFAGAIRLYVRADILASELYRIERAVEPVRLQLMRGSLGQEPVAVDALPALQVQTVDAERELVAALIAGFLPYILLLFCYLGAMYPAIDLAAGEKERATMETLLTAPATRTQIVLGKFFVVVLAGVASALIAILGLYAGVQLVGPYTGETLETVRRILQPQAVLLISILLVPLAMFVAGLLLALSIFARSFKEAQSLISPLALVILLPAGVGLIPQVELTQSTALVPVLNVSLVTKAIIQGTLLFSELALAMTSLIVFASMSLAVCSLYFENERVIFRS